MSSKVKFKPGDLVYYPLKEYFARVIHVLPEYHQGVGPRCRIQKIFHINGEPSKRQKRFVIEAQRFLVKMDQAECDKWAERIRNMPAGTKEFNEKDDPRMIDV